MVSTSCLPLDRLFLRANEKHMQYDKASRSPKREGERETGGQREVARKGIVVVFAFSLLDAVPQEGSLVFACVSACVR